MSKRRPDYSFMVEGIELSRPEYSFILEVEGISTTGCSVVRYPIVLMPNCLGAQLSWCPVFLVPNCTGAQLSGAQLSWYPVVRCPVALVTSGPMPSCP